MKKFVSALAAISLLLPVVATSAYAAQPQQERHDDRGGERHDERTRTRAGTQTSKANPFRKGQKFESRRAPNYRVVDYRSHRGLKAPPRGYRYVRSGHDILLIRISSGIVASVYAGMIR